jgi:D-3-phosphoglycerate dehydrogenase
MSRGHAVSNVLIIEGYLASLMPEGPAIEQATLGSQFDVLRFGALAEVPADMLADAAALIVRPGVAFGAEQIRGLHQCKVIVSLGVGYEHIDRGAAREHGIPVCNVPDFGPEEAADTALSMMLHLHRRMGALQARAHSGPLEWDWRVQQPTHRARDSALGIIGLGLIGTSFALKAKAIGYNVSFFDPYVPRGMEKSLGFARVHDMEDLLPTSDIVSIHTPLTDDTRGMVNAAFLDAMKSDGVLLNISRGGLFESLDVLYDHLRRRPDFCVGADVVPEEPPGEHPLLDAWRSNTSWLSGRFFLTPHSAFYSEESVRDLRRFSAETAAWALSGNPPYNVVNR